MAVMTRRHAIALLLAALAAVAAPAQRVAAELPPPRAAAPSLLATLFKDDTLQRQMEQFRREQGQASAATTERQPNCSKKALPFRLPLDHFNAADERTWVGRYWVCDGFYTKGSRQPIFFYLGEESGMIGAFNSLFMDQAREEGGLLVYAEHRYYGKSLPLGEASLTNTGLRWLTVEQALADYALIATKLRQHYQVPEEAITVAYGCSYGGSLAAYARLRHPDVFHAAHACSPVVKFVLPTQAFEATKYDSWDTVAAALRDAGGPACYARAQAAFDALQGPLSATPAGRQQLAAAMGMCEDAPLTDRTDVDTMRGRAMQAWWSAFQKDFQWFSDPEDNRVMAACGRAPLFPATPLGSVRWLFNFTRGVFMEPDEEDGSYACFSPMWLAPSFSEQDGRPEVPDTVSYMYQNCRQGVPVSTYFWSRPASLFGPSEFDLSRLRRWCQANYGVQYPLAPAPWMRYTFQDYTRAGRIIFGTSSYDPWRPGAVLRPLGGSVHAVTTPRFTHCSELYGPSTSAVVNATQAYIKGIVRQWAAQGPYAGRHGGTLHAGTVAGSH